MEGEKGGRGEGKGGNEGRGGMKGGEMGVEEEAIERN